MNTHVQIPEPILFKPLKHHLGFIKEFIYHKTECDAITDTNNLIKELKHLGSSVTDVYSGSLSSLSICIEVKEFLEQKVMLSKASFSHWAGENINDFKIISISDGSQWTLKLHDNRLRFVHIFPARNSKYTFRVKSNTIKSASLYLIIIGKDFITRDDLNKVRILLGMSPIKDPIDTKAITEMIEILRG